MLDRKPIAGLERHDTPDGGHNYTFEGKPVPSVSQIIAWRIGAVPNMPHIVDAADRGHRLHAMIRRALLGLELAPPDAGDSIGADAWARFAAWRMWYPGSGCMPAYLEQPVIGGEGSTRWAGTVDMLGACNGAYPALVDWKPGWNTRYKLQLTAYCIAAEQCGFGDPGDLTPIAVIIPGKGRVTVREAERHDDEWRAIVRDYYAEHAP